MAKKSNPFKGNVRKNIDKKKAERSGGSSYLNLPDGVEMFKPEAGKAFLDILPYLVTDAKHLDRDDESGIATEGEIWWKKPFRVHKNIGVDNITVVCPSMFGMKCPICEHFKAEQDKDAEWEDIKDFKYKDRSLYVVLPVDVDGFDKKYKQEPYIFDMSYHLFEKQLEEELESEDQYEGFPSLEDGFTLSIRFKQKKFGKAEYCETSRIDFEERDEQYDEDYLEEIPNLDDMLIVKTYEELTLLFNMEDAEDADVTEVKDEKPKRERRKKSEEKEEEEAPPKRTRSRKSDKEEVEEDTVKKTRTRKAPKEEEAEEEEEPVKKTRTRSKKTEDKDEDEKCPHGLKYGVDTESQSVCDSCELWEDCIEAKENS